jgi:hypothetical protein
MQRNILSKSGRDQHAYGFGAQKNMTSTYLYRTYNVFSLVGRSKHFYDLLKDLSEAIKITMPQQPYLWFQCWLNFHSQGGVLNWHNHNSLLHGYVSIDPKNTKTIFENYEIHNSVGNIYIGPGNRKHKVEVLEPYQGHRVTLGFDVANTEMSLNDTLSSMPVI